MKITISSILAVMATLSFVSSTTLTVSEHSVVFDDAFISILCLVCLIVTNGAMFTITTSPVVTYKPPLHTFLRTIQMGEVKTLFD